MGGAPVGRERTDPPVPGVMADKEGGGGLGQEEPAEPHNIYYFLEFLLVDLTARKALSENIERGLTAGIASPRTFEPVRSVYFFLRL